MNKIDRELKVTFIGIIFFLAVNIVGVSYGYGRVCERLDDLKLRVERIENNIINRAQIISTGGFIK